MTLKSVLGTKKMKTQKHTIIYVTGLNDKNVSLQKLVIKFWGIYGVRPVMFQTNWVDGKSYSEKLERLSDLIKDQSSRNQAVSLIAASAGASLAVATYVKLPASINGVVFICGKLRRPETVGESYYKKNPAFKDAMDKLNSNIAKLSTAQKKKLLSIHPLFDETVVRSDTKIKGVKSATILTLFHVPSIALGISIFSFVPIFFLRRLVK